MNVMFALAFVPLRPALLYFFFLRCGIRLFGAARRKRYQDTILEKQPVFFLRGFRSFSYRSHTLRTAKHHPHSKYICWEANLMLARQTKHCVLISPLFHAEFGGIA